MEIMIKVRDAIKMIEADGWYLIKTEEVINNTSITQNQVE